MTVPMNQAISGDESNAGIQNCSEKDWESEKMRWPCR
jgi:hypothetical protein